MFHKHILLSLTNGRLLCNLGLAYSCLTSKGSSIDVPYTFFNLVSKSIQVNLTMKCCQPNSCLAYLITWSIKYFILPSMAGEIDYGVIVTSATTRFSGHASAY